MTKFLLSLPKDHTATVIALVGIFDAVKRNRTTCDNTLQLKQVLKEMNGYTMGCTLMTMNLRIPVLPNICNYTWKTILTKFNLATDVLRI